MILYNKRNILYNHLFNKYLGLLLFYIIIQIKFYLNINIY